MVCVGGSRHDCLPGSAGIATAGVATRVATTGEPAVATLTAEATGAGSTTLTLLGALDADVTAIKLLPIEGRDGGVGTIVVGVGDEAEATAAAGLAVTDNDGVLDLAVLLELGTETLGVSVPGETTDEKLDGHVEGKGDGGKNGPVTG